MNRTDTITEEEFKAIEQTRRDITIKLYRAELPETIRGFSHLNRNGSYLIFLNSTKSKRQKAASFLHECLHIYHQDHNREDLTASQIEAIRHAELLEIIRLLEADIEN